MTTYQDPADILAEHCESDHDRRDADCANCDIRADIQHCANCDADYVDGQWWTGLGTTAPNGCDHAALIDDWSNEIVCATVIDQLACADCGKALEHDIEAESWLKRTVLFDPDVVDIDRSGQVCPETSEDHRAALSRRCGVEVETAGKWHCDFHQRWIDAAECDRVYQALVASPPAVTLRVVS